MADQIVVTKTGLETSGFTEVTLVKVVPFSAATSIADALAALGNDNAKLLEIVNAGLAETAREAARKDSAPWHTYKLDESGEPLKGEDGQLVVNGPFAGKLVDGESLNPILLTLAKMPGMGWPEKGEKGDTAKMKREAKDKALAKIKASPALLEMFSA